MTVILITCVMAWGKDGAFASNWVATRIIFAPSRSFSSAWGFFYEKSTESGGNKYFCKVSFTYSLPYLELNEHLNTITV